MITGGIECMHWFVSLALNHLSFCPSHTHQLQLLLLALFQGFDGSHTQPGSQELASPKDSPGPRFLKTLRCSHRALH